MLDVLVEQPIIALIVAAFAGWAALSETVRWIRVLLATGSTLAFGSWLPIVLGGLVDPEGRFIGNGLGLLLLAVFGSLLGVALSVLGLGIHGVRLVIGQDRAPFSSGDLRVRTGRPKMTPSLNASSADGAQRGS